MIVQGGVPAGPAQRRGATLVLAARRCAEAESGLAYGGLADLLGRAAETAPPGLPSPQRRALG